MNDIKQKRGRKPIDPKNRKRVLSISISTEQMLALKSLAMKKEKSLSKLLRDYIDNILIVDSI